MTRDILGPRGKIGIVVPSTNTVVEPEMSWMQPSGVTNHVGRMLIPDMKLDSDEDFAALIAALTEAQGPAIDGILSCAPDHLILGLSVETFWDGVEAARAQTQALRQRLGIGVSAASEAMLSLLDEIGIHRVAVLTPYQPEADARVTRFLTASGVEVVATSGLRCSSPVATAAMPRDVLARAVLELADSGAQAVVQVGTNLPMTTLARDAEAWAGLPVIATNPVLYRDALRQIGALDDAAFLTAWMPSLRDRILSGQIS